VLPIRDVRFINVTTPLSLITANTSHHGVLWETQQRLPRVPGQTNKGEHPFEWLQANKICMKNG
jgi:hypothetical protein